LVEKGFGVGNRVVEIGIVVVGVRGRSRRRPWDSQLDEVASARDSCLLPFGLVVFVRGRCLAGMTVLFLCQSGLR
jgi:hypothetical protein